MSIEYKWTRLSPVLDREGNVTAWIARLSARDTTRPELGRVSLEGQFPANPIKPLTDWTLPEALAWVESCASRQPEPIAEGGQPGQNWYQQLEARLKSRAERPVIGPSLIPEPTLPKDTYLALIDKETELAINQAMHPMAEYGEQIGILREMLVRVVNFLGIEPTEEFRRLCEVAIQEIEKGRAKKEEISNA